MSNPIHSCLLACALLFAPLARAEEPRPPATPCESVKGSVRYPRAAQDETVSAYRARLTEAGLAVRGEKQTAPGEEDGCTSTSETLFLPGATVEALIPSALRLFDIEKFAKYVDMTGTQGTHKDFVGQIRVQFAQKKEGMLTEIKFGDKEFYVRRIDVLRGKSERIVELKAWYPENDADSYSSIKSEGGNCVAIRYNRSSCRN